MIGAIIGDIAAWTYEHDREAFWNQLISYDDKVSLSEFGRAYYAGGKLESVCFIKS